MRGNEKIIHRAFYKQDGDIVYLCNQAFIANEDKITNHWEDVTCKNCRKKIEGKNMTKTLKEYKPEEEHIFVEHIRRHLYEMDEDDKRPYCKICDKPIDEIVKEETMKGIWTASGLYFPAYEYIDRNGKKFKITEVK